MKDPASNQSRAESGGKGQGLELEASTQGEQFDKLPSVRRGFSPYCPPNNPFELLGVSLLHWLFILSPQRPSKKSASLPRDLHFVGRSPEAPFGKVGFVSGFVKNHLSAPSSKGRSTSSIITSSGSDPSRS